MEPRHAPSGGGESSEPERQQGVRARSLRDNRLRAPVLGALASPSHNLDVQHITNHPSISLINLGNMSLITLGNITLITLAYHKSPKHFTNHPMQHITHHPRQHITDHPRREGWSPATPPVEGACALARLLWGSVSRNASID